MSKSKPPGVVVISIYSAISGFLVVLVGVAMLFGSAFPSAPIIFLAAGLVFSVLGVLYIAATYGLWVLKAWGRKLTWWLNIFAIPLGIVSIFPLYPVF